MVVREDKLLIWASDLEDQARRLQDIALSVRSGNVVSCHECPMNIHDDHVPHTLDSSCTSSYFILLIMLDHFPSIPSL